MQFFARKTALSQSEIEDVGVRRARIDQSLCICSRGASRVASVLERSFDNEPEYAATRCPPETFRFVDTHGGIKAFVVVMCYTGRGGAMRKDQRVDLKSTIEAKTGCHGETFETASPRGMAGKGASDSFEFPHNRPRCSAFDESERRDSDGKDGWKCQERRAGQSTTSSYAYSEICTDKVFKSFHAPRSIITDADYGTPRPHCVRI